jgi:phosphohistidine swiveling domain-containing protein
MVVSFTDDFRVTWADPKDSELTWRSSKDHFPLPLSPLAQGILSELMYRMADTRTAFINGYMYTFAAPARQDELPEIRERGGATAWLEDYEPRINRICSRIRGGHFDAMAMSELLEALDGFLNDTAEVCRYTMAVVPDFRRPAFELLDYCDRELGPDAVPIAAALLQGTDNPSADSGSGLGALAEMAARSPDVARALVEGRFEVLRSLPEAADFLRNLDAFLEKYGWRAEDAGSLHRVAWAEEPDRALRMIASYVAQPDHAPTAAIIRSRKQRAEAQRQLEERLPREKVAEFRDLLEASRLHVPINESRNYWQLTAIGLLRLPALAVGRRLAQAGVLVEANDVFFLYLDELEGAARLSGPETQALVTKRKADFERWHALFPPPFLGPPPRPENVTAQSTPALRYVRYASDGIVGEQSQREVITGIGASRGIVSGTARIIRSLEEAARLRPGDILVCVTTSPPWTALFSIAGGVITDTGGLLSHSAICAREYAIPCVVGTGVATSTIADGSAITMDGSTGRVTVRS